MSLLVLVVCVAGVTVMSRLAPMLLLRPLEGLAGEVIERLPAPLFAALAVLSFVPSSGAAADPAIGGAMVGALLVWRVRSLLLTLAAGLTGYLIVATILG